MHHIPLNKEGDFMKLKSINIFVCLFLYIALLSNSCKKEEAQSLMTSIEQLQNNYTLLPEAQISISKDQTILACYTEPTERYKHGILGDQIEAGRLVISINATTHELPLQEEYVFEDIRPRLYDVDKDGQLEFVTIRSNVNEGAGIVIYKILVDQIIEYAMVPEIGIANRWLNIVAIDDLDNDGVIELAWIETPHIGGILKIAKIQAGILEVITEKSLYSNHAIGQRNLCLSILTEQEEQKVFYVPNQARDTLVGFTFDGVDLNIIDAIEKDIDFSIPLMDQYDFSGLVMEEQDNCIFLE